MIVLVLVAVLWIAVLLPSLYSKLADRRSAHSIDHFHEQLHLLERTGPKLVTPAHRLNAPDPVRFEMPAIVPSPPPPVYPSLVLLQSGEAQLAESPEHQSETLASDRVIVRLRTELAPPDLAVLQAEQPRRDDRRSRQLARRRRRDVLGILIAASTLTGLLGFVHSLRGAWVASAVFLVCAVSFVILALYGQSLEVDRARRASSARPSAGASISYLERADSAEQSWSQRTAAGGPGSSRPA